MNKKVILVGVSGSDKDFEYSMIELSNLAEANHYEVLDVVKQNMDRLNKATYVGKGKVEELKQIAEMLGANALVMNDELTASQIRNLEMELELEIIDRTALVLAIFAERAKTREAQLQVEIARLKYELPRLAFGDDKLDQQSGASGMANRGSGEKKIESDRRIIKNQIRHLTKELEEIVKERETRRRKRKKNEIPIVSLVGYTNAGKSTTMNGLVERFSKSAHKQVFEKDMLFATLETSIREIILPDKKQFLLTDTVGFVSKLPTHLVKAFRSTLEEAKEADLLLHVVDYSDENYHAMIETTEKTLEAVGIKDIPVLFIFNKADKVAGAEYPELKDGGLIYSAKDTRSLKMLTQKIAEQVFEDYKEIVFLIPFDRGDIISYLNEHARVLAQEYTESGAELRAEVSPVDAERFHAFQMK